MKSIFKRIINKIKKEKIKINYTKKINKLWRMKKKLEDKQYLIC